MTDTSKVFHSFRHTFKRLCRDADIREEVHDVLTGHSSGGVGRTYGKGMGVAALADAMSRIQVPLAVKSLRWSPLGP